MADEMTEPEIVWEIHKLHGHWVGDHSDCRPGGSLCAEQDAKLAKRESEELGYWIEVHPSGWPHRRIPTSEPVTPGWRAQWVRWDGPGPVPPIVARTADTDQVADQSR
jgi:hypothetical protein